jgi:succinate dehydrogenase/fumarate reductase-like Fe-S protein
MTTATKSYTSEFSQLKELILDTADLFRNYQQEVKSWNEALKIKSRIEQEYLRRQNQIKEEIYGICSCFSCQ